ncbi:hypothetical protein M3181_21970 [Mesobacillus maritimus]|uniref:hypothetical protein n=1 Tax=Mesobacillus maritimus TaxID=1643336 RepID=UPI00203CBE1A|nr:hypothetical protein [Mesobacillus maritimus]MCM3671627.1 hypothetical protein [Mesobacillus maritimus]
MDNLLSITIEHGQRFLQAYADGEIGNRERKEASTVYRANIEVARFYIWLQKMHKKKVSNIYTITMLESEEYRDKDGKIGYYQKTPFDLVVSDVVRKQVFRDIPNKVFWKLLRLSQIYYPDITLGLCLQAFCGLRPGEVCNVRQLVCPLDGGGYTYSLYGGKLESFTINLTNKYPMRSDMVDVGGIKKRRHQTCYKAFLPVLEHYYNLHIERLKNKFVEPGYFPLFVNEDGMALTVESYREKFKKLVHTHLMEAIKDSEDFEVRNYAQLLLTHELAPHSLRHWFTVQLVLQGESASEIAMYRGDNNLDTALIYIRNKSELLKMHKKANASLIQEMMKFGNGGVQN